MNSSCLTNEMHSKPSQPQADMYELLQYFIDKLETRKSMAEIAHFLLEFLIGIILKKNEVAPASLFLADTKTFEFTPTIILPETTDPSIVINELNSHIDNGIVAWCINNRRVAFSPVQPRPPGRAQQECPKGAAPVWPSLWLLSLGHSRESDSGPRRRTK